MSVLILSHSHDEHLDLILPHLTEQFLVLYADRPFQFLFDPQGQYGSIEQEGGTLMLGDISAVWNRRPFSIPGHELPHQKFTRYEVRACVLQSLVASVPFSRWVNHPDAVASARDKATTLGLARRCGLDCPNWLVSNHADAILEFAEENGGEIVLKPLVSVHEALSEIPGLLYARPLSMSSLERKLSSEEVFFPMFLQQRIRKVADWRISIIDGFISAVRMTGCPDDTVDFRRAYDALSYESVLLDPVVASRVRSLMTEMRLRYAAVDMVEDMKTNRLLFLEVNAAGQFGWMEESVGSGGQARFAEHLAEALSQEGK